WTLPAKVLLAYQNVTRVIDSLSVSFELGELFVGTMQYALRVSVLKPNNMSSQWTYQGNMTWLPPSLALPSLRAETHEALDVVNVEINTSVPFDTIAFIRLNNVSLDVSDQLIVTFWNAFNFATPSCVTAYVVRSATNYPAMHLVDVLTPEGSWTVPSMSSTGERNESRLTAQVSMAIQMPPSYVGLTQYAIQVTQRPSSRTSVLNWMYRVKATWENAPSDPLPVLGVPSPTQLSIGSIRPDSLVPFNTSGTIELSDVAVGMSDAVTIHVRIDSPAVAKSVAVFVVQTVDNYPPMHYLNASSGNGTFMLPRLVLSTTQNLTRALSSVSISIQMAHYFVGSISYTVRLSTQPSQTQYLYRGNMTWQSKVAALVPPIHPAVVAFNSSGTLELSNIPLDISDQLQVDVRVLDPLASNVITTLLAVESMDMYPSVLPAYQNVTRVIDSLSVSFELGELFVGTMQYALRVQHDLASSFFGSSIPSCETHEALDVVNVEINTSVPFDTIAFIRLNNVSLDVSDQLIVTVRCPVGDDYPAMHLVDVLTPEGSWTVPSMSSTGERNESRLTAQVSMAIQMPPSYVGLTQYAIQVTQRPSSRTSVLNWMYRVKATWENAPSDPLPVLGVPSPTQLSIGSIRPDSLVPFNTSGTIELSDVAVGMSDAVTIHVRIDSPAVAKSVAVFVVQTVDNYPPMHYLNASSGNGTFMLPRLVLSTTQNLTRALSSVSISIQMAHYFVGSISYTVRLSTQPSQTQYLYRGNMTWQSKVAALVPPIHPAVVTPLAIGSVQVDEVVAFNSSGTLELSNIPLDISDQLCDVRVLDPLASNVITTLLAVESMDMYPSGYWPVVLDQGTWTLPAKVLRRIRT
ncbi:transmembrane protein, partial [Aphanomyces euteiches]